HSRFESRATHRIKHLIAGSSYEADLRLCRCLRGKGGSELSLAEIQEPRLSIHLPIPRRLRARVLSLLPSRPIRREPSCLEVAPAVLNYVCSAAIDVFHQARVVCDHVGSHLVDSNARYDRAIHAQVSPR